MERNDGQWMKLMCYGVWYVLVLCAIAKGTRGVGRRKGAVEIRGCKR